MVKSWSSTFSRCSVFVLRDLVTSGGFFDKELQEEEEEGLEKVSRDQRGLGLDDLNTAFNVRLSGQNETVETSDVFNRCSSIVTVRNE